MTAKTTLVIRDEVLIDSVALADALPGATAAVMAAHFGGEAAEWETAYRHILADWESYWADLDLDGDESLAGWREGRWRVTRALFRLTGSDAPSQDSIPLHLDDLPREIGCRCSAWRAGAVDGLRGLAERGTRLAILALGRPATLWWGFLDAVTLENKVVAVLGPDEIGQVGLAGVAWIGLVNRLKVKMERCILVGDPDGLIGPVRAVQPPADLGHLTALEGL